MTTLHHERQKMPTQRLEPYLRIFPVALAAEAQYSSYFTHGLLLAHAKAYQEGALKQDYIFGKITPFTESEIDSVLNDLLKDNLPTVFLLSSYVWNHESNLIFARKVKQLIPNSLVIIGGPNVPKAEKPCRQFMNVHHCIDVAVRGEGEVTLSEILATVAEKNPRNANNIRWTDLSAINGLTFRKPDLQLVRTPDRQRMPDINIVPSPYLTGEFEHLAAIPWTAVIETNRGCPFSCTFCDWGGATLSKIHKFDEQRILDEIEYLAKNGVERILIADANFGTFERDITFAEKIVAMKRQYGFPKTIHYFLAKNSPERVARLVRILHEENMLVDIVASLQTTDPVVLKNIGRGNIKESSYTKLIENFVELGLQPETDILVGLPGQTIDSLSNDLQFSFDRNILARTFLVSILPNSPMADEEYRERFAIKTDQQGYVRSTYSFDEKDLQEMLLLRTAYMFFVEEETLRLLLVYLQFEHGINALDFIRLILKIGKSHSENHPWLSWACAHIINTAEYVGTISLKWNKKGGKLFRHFRAFLCEICSIAESHYNCELNPEEIEAIKDFQELIMPLPGVKSGAFDMKISYDIPSYLQQFKSGMLITSRQINPLSTFKQSRIVTIPEQYRLDQESLGYFKTHINPWALQYV